MTQPILFAVEDDEDCPATEDAMIEQPPKKDDVRKSAIVQRLFEIAALERGYEIAVNIEGGKDFDVIVRRSGGRPVVIQIKNAPWTLNSYYQISNSSRNTGVYSAKAYDVLAVYLSVHKQWLFYLRAELGNRTATTFQPREYRKVARKSHNGKHGIVADRDPDNWELLDEVAQSLLA